MGIFHIHPNDKSSRWIWEQKDITPFDELIVSWNGLRPKFGYWEISLSLFQNEWSPLIKYAEWGMGRQKTFRFKPDESLAFTDQDVIRPKTGLCTGFKIEIVAKEKTNLENLHRLTASTSLTNKSYTNEIPPQFKASTFLSPIPRQSQQILHHARCKDLCSPTSTCVAINYLLNGRSINPVTFAELVRDQEFDIYGNWILNTAAAYDATNGKYPTYVTRLECFSKVITQLEKGLPVVLSIRGPLKGAPLPYANGHLLMVSGYDSKFQRVICMDPGFSSNEETETSYEFENFLEAWGKRSNLAYIFEDKLNPS